MFQWWWLEREKFSHVCMIAHLLASCSSTRQIAHLLAIHLPSCPVLCYWG